jgi:hypothetical protein
MVNKRAQPSLRVRIIGSVSAEHLTQMDNDEVFRLKTTNNSGDWI